MFNRPAKFYCVILLVLGIGLTSCQVFKNDNQAIKDTVTELFYDYSNRKYTELAELFSSEKRKGEGDYVILDGLHSEFSRETMTIREISEPTIIGSIATVSVRAVGRTFAAASPYRIKLIKEGWSWKISDISR